MTRPWLLLTLVLASACTVLPEPAPVDIYQLPPPTLAAAGSGQLIDSLRIDRPLTGEVLGGNRLLIMTADNQFQAMPAMRLATPVPLLWRDWLLDAFWRDGRIGGLSASSEGLEAGLELGGQLRAFHIDNSGARPAAVIQYDALLIATAGRTIVASRRFETRVEMTALDGVAAVNALGEAANRLARDLIGWVAVEGIADR